MSAEKAFALLHQIAALQGRARGVAYDEIARQARAIMKRHPRCASFTMCMGMWSFYDKQGEPISTFGPLPYPEYLRPFDEFASRMDAKLNVSGMPMKINGPDADILTDW